MDGKEEVRIFNNMLIPVKKLQKHHRKFEAEWSALYISFLKKRNYEEVKRYTVIPMCNKCQVIFLPQITRKPAPLGVG